MNDRPAPHRDVRGYHWLLVLSLVGLDYFSTLAYLPSIALQAAGAAAPLAALGVVAVTLIGALPVYFYVVGRSPQGEGASGLLERRVHGWLGKFVVLVLLGFVATDFVITRTLSVADASLHIVHNPSWREHVHWFNNHSDAVRSSLPAWLQGRFFDFWTERLVLTVILTVAGFGFFFFFRVGRTRTFLQMAAAVVVSYLLLTAVIVGSSLWNLAHQPNLLDHWWQQVERAALTGGSPATYGTLAFLALFFFPRVALGLSGFELSMATAPLVRGKPGDTQAEPRGRIRNARKLLLVAALVMAVLVPASTLVATLAVPGEFYAGTGTGDGAIDFAQYRTLAFIAHGESDLALEICPLAGPTLGTLYDLSAVLILCFAGASAVLGIRDLVPGFLARYGMQLEWARKVGVILHLFNCIVLVVTLYFHASVTAQQGAYASSVLALLTGAAVAALLDVRACASSLVGRYLAPLPFLALVFFFVAMTGLTIYHHASGMAIALAFIGVVLTTSLVSRYIRNKELRFHGFEFVDPASEKRWHEIRQLDFQVLVPHRPGLTTIPHKEDEVRHRHRLGPDVPIIFIEVTLGDASEFYQQPRMEIYRDKGRELIHVSRCASVPHVIAAVALEFTHVGRPPEIIFGWSQESPVTANLSFLFLGQGNVPWMVHYLIQHLRPDPEKQPRVIIG